MKSSAATINCAYLLGGTVPHFDQTYRDLNPRAEFQEFMRRNVTTAYDFASILQHSTSFVGKRLKPKVHFACAAATWRQESAVAIASGEDIGILCATLDLISMRKNPILIVTHGSYFGSRYWAYMARVLRTQKHVHWACLSTSLAECMINEHGFSPGQVHSCGYGVDTDFFSPQIIDDSYPMILAAGTANRDYKTLVSAVHGLDVEVRIAADSAWYPVETNVQGLELPTNIILKSAGNYLGLRELYAACRFVVVPMLPARFACGYAVIAEAMAMGKAVIATRTQVVSDFIRDGENGFLVEVGDVSGLRERIEWMLNNPMIATTMGQQARKDIEEHWSLPAYCQRLESALTATSSQFTSGGNPESSRFNATSKSFLNASTT